MRLLRSPLAIEDVEVEARVVSGAPARAIEGVASETNARLIVAGSHGRGLAGRRLVGSVAQHLVLNSPCAVLVVRDAGRTSLERAARGAEAAASGGGNRSGGGWATEAALEWVRQLCARGRGT